MATGDTMASADARSALLPATDYARLTLRNGRLLIAFEDATDTVADFPDLLPSHYSGGDLSVFLRWAADTATTGGVRWQVAFERQSVNDGATLGLDLDADAFATAAEATDTTAAIAGELSVATLTLTGASLPSPMAGETYRLRIKRLGTDVADTLVGDAQLLAVEIKEV